MDDEQTRRAIELLVDAVAKEIKPGVFELKLAASTLRDLLDDPTPQSFSLAIRAFNAIDGEVRKRIQQNAQSAAMVYCTKTGRKISILEPVGGRQGKRQATGLLGALNFGGAGQTRKDDGRKR
ncbi:MAG: hypothetical protein WCO00_13435 [Rhodospirillaceae bacterium]